MAHVWATTSRGFWRLAFERLMADRVGVASFVIVALFLVLVILSALGVVASEWNREVGINNAPPNFWGAVHTRRYIEEPVMDIAPSTTILPSSPQWASQVIDPLDDVLKEITNAEEDHADPARIESEVIDPLADALATIRESTKAVAVANAKYETLPLGGDRWGRDVLQKTIKGSQTSILVGLISALLATLIGTLLGAAAGFYGGFVDDALNWLYNVFVAIPYLLLILAIAAVLQQRGVPTVVLIFGLTGWTGVFRLIRAEYLKHRSREYVLAARAFGVPPWRVMFFHILPNVSHIVLVEISLLAVGFIKAEVILSFLGFGVRVDEVSWGSMLNEAQTQLILGYWWELAAATVAMALLVTAFSLLTDALRDALDPKIHGNKGGVA